MFASIIVNINNQEIIWSEKLFVYNFVLKLKKEKYILGFTLAAFLYFKAYGKLKFHCSFLLPTKPIFYNNYKASFYKSLLLIVIFVFLCV